jgi:hypothetical protein
MFLQSIGLLPDNVVVLSNNRKKAEDRIVEKLKQGGHKEKIETLAKNSIDESELNIGAVKEIYKGFSCDISTVGKSQNSIVEEITVKNIIIILGYL